MSEVCIVCTLPKSLCGCEKTYSNPIQEMRDAYWNAKDEFEHNIRELFGHYISPEEFEKKWRPRLQSSLLKENL